MAAVRPAGPEPMMITSRTSSMELPLYAGVGLAHEQPADENEDSSDDAVRHPDAAGVRLADVKRQVGVEGADGCDRDEDQRHDAEDPDHDAVDQGAGDRGDRHDGLVA